MPGLTATDPKQGHSRDIHAGEILGAGGAIGPRSPVGGVPERTRACGCWINAAIIPCRVAAVKLQVQDQWQIGGQGRGDASRLGPSEVICTGVEDSSVFARCISNGTASAGKQGNAAAAGNATHCFTAEGMVYIIPAMQ